MKALPTLIRLAKRELDALRQELSAVETLAQQARLQIAAHEQAILREQQIALSNYEAGRAYGGYASVALAQRRVMESQIQALDQEAERIRGLVSAAHVEMKKVERLLELQDERAADAARRAEDAALDEMATQNAGRRARY